jgi:hypothetical protein
MARIKRQQQLGVNKEANLAFKVPPGGFRKVTSPGNVKIVSLSAQSTHDTVLEVRTQDDLIERNPMRAGQALKVKNVGTTGNLCVLVRNRSEEEASVEIQMVWQLL